MNARLSRSVLGVGLRLSSVGFIVKQCVDDPDDCVWFSSNRTVNFNFKPANMK